MDYKSNSHKSREQTEPAASPRKLEPVAQSAVKKKSGLQKVVGAFVSRDANNIKDYIVETVVIPGITNSISGIGDIIIDSLIEGIGALFSDSGFSVGERKLHGTKTSYSGYYNRRKRDRDYDDDDVRDRHDYDDIRVKTRGEAERVIAELRLLIREDGYASVAHLYELVGQIPVYTDHRYGWKSLDSADWVRTRDIEYPYLLKFPQPKPLD